MSKRMIPISSWIEDDLFIKFKAYCQSQDRSMSQVIRKLIKDKIDKTPGAVRR